MSCESLVQLSMMLTFLVLVYVLNVHSLKNEHSGNMSIAVRAQLAALFVLAALLYCLR